MTDQNNAAVDSSPTTLPCSIKELLVLWLLPTRYIWAFSVTIKLLGAKRRNSAQQTPILPTANE